MYYCTHITHNILLQSVIINNTREIYLKKKNEYLDIIYYKYLYIF